LIERNEPMRLITSQQQNIVVPVQADYLPFLSPPLQQCAGVSFCRKISHDIAKPFIEKWHYSARCPTGKNIFFGWFVHGDDDLFGETLYAVADYGIGVNPYQAKFLSDLTGINVKNECLLELKRLCRTEPKHESLSLTSFISKCHKILKREGYRYIISFSDPSYGHDGGIYKAANFKHLGKTNAETHAIEEDGTVRHRRLYFRYARRNGIDVSTARDELNLKLVKTPQKDRWFIKL
jgi:hypothetical protein